MGPSTSARSQRRLAPILSARHGSAHQAQIPVREALYLDSSLTLLTNVSYFCITLLPTISPHLFSQPGQTSVNEVKRSDLRKELLAAEAEARAKKRKAAGLPVENEQPVVAAIEDEESNKRRKLLQEALELDKDSDSDEDENEDGPANGGNARCVAHFTVSLFGDLCSSVVLKTQRRQKWGRQKWQWWWRW
jgi:hypothetical protein